MLIEGLVECGELSDEGGVPRVERWEVGYIGVVVNISCEVIRDRWLST